MKTIAVDEEIKQLNRSLISAIIANRNNFTYAVDNSNNSVQEDQERLITENKEFKKLMRFF